MSDNHPFKGRYGRRVREIKLMAQPLCEDCEKRGVTRVAVTVHHIIAVEDGGPHYAYSNLASLCGDCHLARHGQLKPEIDPKTGLPAGAHPWSE